ncbi:hypothetical protein C0993_001511, partial [Termitomyces sp. T159_Od127]
MSHLPRPAQLQAPPSTSSSFPSTPSRLASSLSRALPVQVGSAAYTRASVASSSAVRLEVRFLLSPSLTCSFCPSRGVLLDLRHDEETLAAPRKPRAAQPHACRLHRRSRAPLSSFSASLASPPLQAACLIRVPTEVIKTRTQTMTYGALGRSSLAAARQVLLNDGWSGFYRGFRSTIIRE